MGDFTCEIFIKSVVRGHHIYKAIWNHTVHEVLVCEQESNNNEDPCAAAVKLGGTIVGHVPRDISSIS